MKILCHCPWIPNEWIRAHGATPLRLFSDEESTLKQEIHVGTCPHVSQFMAFSQEQQEQVDAVIFSTMCDQMRRNSELFHSEKPHFLFNLPSTWQTPTARKLYQYELLRLGKWLTSLTGISCSEEKLRKELTLSFENRQRLFDAIAEHQLISSDFIQLEAQLFETGNLPEEFIFSPQKTERIPLLLIGSPTALATEKLFHLIEQFDGRIAINFSEGGWHDVPTQIDKRLLAENAFEAMLTAYEELPGIFQRPNTSWYQKIRKIISSQEIQGIIFWQQPWCDLWHGEVQRFKAWCSLPILHITVNDHGDMDAHTSGRLEAFMEIFKN